MPPINPKDKIKSMKKKSSFNKKGPQSIGIYFILFIIVLGLYGFLFIPQETQNTILYVHAVEFHLHTSGIQLHHTPR